MNKQIITKNINDVIFREDLYPRFEPDQKTIQKYAYALEQLPPIMINQNNILIDGFHRWKAHQLEKKATIQAEIIETKSEQELKLLAYKTNSIHGLQLTNEEKQKFAREMFGVIPDIEIIQILSIGKSTFYKWTETQRDQAKDELNKRILDLYLHAWNTQESIASELGIDQANVSRTIENIMQNSTDGKMHKDFNPYLYNIWNLQKQDNSTASHFGSFPQVFMENLLYYHTEPMDIIYDPFAGGGTTVDVCKKWLRRFYCSDRIVKPGREKDIKSWDIINGLPDDLQKPKLVFLDPPYWKQALNKYSNDANDLANMTLENFNKNMNELLLQLKKRKVELIAIVIQPTQYSNNFQLADHIFDFHQMLSDKYVILMRYILPYSTQQYNAQMVDKAKEAKQCLTLNRDLVVWKLK